MKSHRKPFITTNQQLIKCNGAPHELHNADQKHSFKEMALFPSNNATTDLSWIHSEERPQNPHAINPSCAGRETCVIVTVWLSSYSANKTNSLSAKRVEHRLGKKLQSILFPPLAIEAAAYAGLSLTRHLKTIGSVHRRCAKLSRTLPVDCLNSVQFVCVWARVHASAGGLDQPGKSQLLLVLFCYCRSSAFITIPSFRPGTYT